LALDAHFIEHDVPRVAQQLRVVHAGTVAYFLSSV
jgi:hypothetical protein